MVYKIIKCHFRSFFTNKNPFITFYTMNKRL